MTVKTWQITELDAHGIGRFGYRYRAYTWPDAVKLWIAATFARVSMGFDPYAPIDGPITVTAGTGEQWSILIREER